MSSLNTYALTNVASVGAQVQHVDAFESVF